MPPLEMPTLRRLLDRYRRDGAWGALTRLGKDLDRDRANVCYYRRVGYIPHGLAWRVEAITEGEITAQEIHDDYVVAQALRQAERAKRAASK